MWEKAGAMLTEQGGQGYDMQKAAYEKLTKACKCEKAGRCEAPSMKGGTEAPPLYPGEKPLMVGDVMLEHDVRVYGEQPTAAKGYSEVVGDALSKGFAKGEKPPGSGWQKVTRGRGYRRRKGAGWEYWYPGQRGAGKPAAKEGEGGKAWHGKLGENTQTFGRAGDPIKITKRPDGHYEAHNMNPNTEAKGDRGFRPVMPLHSGDFDPEKGNSQFRMQKGATVGYPPQGVQSSGAFAPLVPSNMASNTSPASNGDNSAQDEHAEQTIGKGAKWSTEYVNGLGDSAFLHIAKGGRKDTQGKTTPRELRMYAVRDANGTFSVSQLQKACAKAPKDKTLGAMEKAAIVRKARDIMKRIGDSAQ
jgi:hypothetical protein